MEFTDDVARGDWIAPRLRGWGVVGGTAPRGFPAYARVFHPATAWSTEGGESRSRRMSWRQIADERGRTWHPLAQWCGLTGALNSQIALAGGGNLEPPEQGRLDVEVLAELATLLVGVTSTPADAVAGIWHGFGELNPESSGIVVWGDPPLSEAERRTAEDAHRAELVAAVDRRVADAAQHGPTLSLPAREYILLTCDVREFADPRWVESAGLGRGGPTPNLLWPEDRAWFLASEIDFDSTIVAGSRELIDGILAAPAVEALEVDADASLAWDADHLNPPPPTPDALAT